MNENNFIVDRIEGDKIVLEGNKGEIIVIDKYKIETTPKEGDVLIKKDNIYMLDIKETQERKNKIRELMKGMWVQ